MNVVEILCWNVNGIRAVFKKGLLDWLSKEYPGILCIQETKAHPDQISRELLAMEDYQTYWNYPERKGYGGVAIFTKESPLSVQYGFAAAGLDLEGRVIIAEYTHFTLLNVYFPNGKQGASRLKYKLDFYEVFLTFMDSLRSQGKKLVICGDFNTAHKEIDLARPKENAKISGFLPVERAWLDKLVDHGYIDTFRYFVTCMRHKDPSP